MDKTQVKRKKKKQFPGWLKAILLKAWIAGAIYYFIGWGLFISTTDQLDVTIVLGTVLGIVTDLIVNRMLLGMERGDKELHQYMMLPKKAFYVFFLNVLYGIVIALVVAYTYHFVNIIAIWKYSLPKTSVALGAEPILFGILCMGYDMLFLQIKKLFIKIFKKKRELGNENQ